METDQALWDVEEFWQSFRIQPSQIFISQSLALFIEHPDPRQYRNLSRKMRKKIKAAHRLIHSWVTTAQHPQSELPPTLPNTSHTDE